MKILITICSFTHLFILWFSFAVLVCWNWNEAHRQHSNWLWYAKCETACRETWQSWCHQGASVEVPLSVQSNLYRPAGSHWACSTRSLPACIVQVHSQAWRVPAHLHAEHGCVCGEQREAGERGINGSEHAGRVMGRRVSCGRHPWVIMTWSAGCVEGAGWPASNVVMLSTRWGEE